MFSTIILNIFYFLAKQEKSHALKSNNIDEESNKRSNIDMRDLLGSQSDMKMSGESEVAVSNYDQQVSERFTTLKSKKEIRSRKNTYQVNH